MIRLNFICIILVLLLNSCDNSESVCIITSSDKLIEIIKEKDIELYELVDGFESYLISSKYLDDTSKSDYLALFNNIFNDSINIPVFEYFDKNADPLELISPRNIHIIDNSISSIDSQICEIFVSQSTEILKLSFQENLDSKKIETFFKNLEEDFYKNRNSRFIILFFTWRLASELYYF